MNTELVNPNVALPSQYLKIVLGGALIFLSISVVCSFLGIPIFALVSFGSSIIVLCAISYFVYRLYKDNALEELNMSWEILRGGMIRASIFLVAMIPAIVAAFIIDAILERAMLFLLAATDAIVQERAFYNPLRYAIGAEIREEASTISSVLHYTLPNLLGLLQLINVVVFSYVLLRTSAIIVGKYAATTRDGLKFKFPIADARNVTAGTGTYSVHSDLLQIHEADIGTIHFASHKVPRGGLSKFTNPKWANHLISRILHKRYVMRTFDKGTYTRLELPCVDGRRFVLWKLDDGQRIVFDYSRLIAFSDDAKLSTRIWFHFASLATGRILLAVAEGPCSIVFEVNGQPGLIPSEAAMENNIPDLSLVAFDVRSQFVLRLNKDLLNFYLNSPVLDFCSGSAAIIDAQAVNGSTNALYNALRMAYRPI